MEQFLSQIESDLTEEADQPGATAAIAEDGIERPRSARVPARSALEAQRQESRRRKSAAPARSHVGADHCIDRTSRPH